MKTIRRFFNNTEAEFARSLLVSAGIEAVLPEEHVNTLGPGFAPGGVQLRVPDEDVERAIKILGGGDKEFAPLPDDFVPPGAGSEEEDAAPPDKQWEAVPACLSVLAAMGAIFMLFTLLAPLSWIYSSAGLTRMGIAATKKKDYGKAENYFDAALAKTPGNDRIYRDRGFAFLEAKNYEKAISDFTEAIKLNPDAWSYRMRGLSNRGTGKNDQALDDFNEAIHLDAKNFRAFLYRGGLYSKTGDAGRAIEDFRRVIELAPEEYVGYNDLAWIYATWPDAGVRDGAKAWELAAKACELSGWENAYCIETLAAAEAESGNFDGAIRHQRKALELARTNNTIKAKMLHQMVDALADYQQKKAYRDLKE